MFEESNNNERDMMRAVRSFLREGEELLWTGQPYTKVKYRPTPYMLFFSLFFFGFAIFWTATASMAAGFFGAFGIPFVLVGAFLLYTSLFGAKNRYRNTVYAVTHERAMIITATRRGINCSDFFFATTPSVHLVDVREDCGTISFRPYDSQYDYDYNYGYYGRRRRGMAYGGVTNTSFEMIEDVHRIYQLITSLIAEKKS